MTDRQNQEPNVGFDIENTVAQKDQEHQPAQIDEQPKQLTHWQELLYATESDLKKFRYNHGQPKNPLRGQLILFGAIQLLMLLGWVCPASMSSLDLESEHKNSNESDSGIAGDFLGLILLRVICALFQIINISIWYCRSHFSKPYHLTHFVITILLVLTSAVTCTCSAMNQFCDSLYSFGMVAAVVVFAEITALTSLHAWLAKLLSLVFFMVSQSIKYSYSFKSGHDLMIIITIILTTTSYAVIAYVCEQHKVSTAELNNPEVQEEKAQTQQNADEIGHCNQRQVSQNEEDSSVAGDKSDDSSPLKVTFGIKNSSSQQQLFSSASFNCNFEGRKNQEKSFTDIIFSKISSGMAITDDWLNTAKLSEDSEEEKNSSACSSQEKNNSAHSQSSYQIIQQVQKRIERLRKRKKQEGLNLQTIQSQILLTNQQFYKIMSEEKTNAANNSLRPATSSKDDPLSKTFSLKEQDLQSTERLSGLIDTNHALHRSDLFTNRCLFPLLTKQFGISSNQMSSFLLQPEEDKKTFQSLHSLARLHPSFVGYFMICPQLIREESGSDSMSQINWLDHKESCKTIKLEIQRFKVGDSYKQVFVINDISPFLNSQKSRLKDNFSKQLTATLCHEVMTPLNCIFNLSEYLRNSCKSIVRRTTQNETKLRESIQADQCSSTDDQRQQLTELRFLCDMTRKHCDLIQTMQSSSKFMKFMICSQMTSVKHGLRQLTLNFESSGMTFESFMQDFMQPYNLQAKRKGIKVILKLHKSVPKNILSDWKLYSEILFHLIQNSFKFGKVESEINITMFYCPLEINQNSPKRQSALLQMLRKQNLQPSRSCDLPAEMLDEIQMMLQLRKLGYLLTVVEDQGCGIDRNEFGQLFTMFNDTSKSFFKTKGIGLGLTTAKILTQCLQGAIHLNSNVDKGTEVAFSVLCRQDMTRVNSKDLKKQLIDIKDQAVFSNVTLSQRSSNLSNVQNPLKRLIEQQPSFEQSRPRNLLNESQEPFDLRMRNQSILTNSLSTARASFGCFFSGVLSRELTKLHYQWRNLTVENNETFVLLPQSENQSENEMHYSESVPNSNPSQQLYEMNQLIDNHDELVHHARSSNKNRRPRVDQQSDNDAPDKGMHAPSESSDEQNLSDVDVIEQLNDRYYGQADKFDASVPDREDFDNSQVVLMEHDNELQSHCSVGLFEKVGAPVREDKDIPRGQKLPMKQNQFQKMINQELIEQEKNDRGLIKISSTQKNIDEIQMMIEQNKKKAIERGYTTNSTHQAKLDSNVARENFSCKQENKSSRSSMALRSHDLQSDKNSNRVDNSESMLLKLPQQYQSKNNHLKRLEVPIENLLVDQENQLRSPLRQELNQQQEQGRLQLIEEEGSYLSGGFPNLVSPRIQDRERGRRSRAESNQRLIPADQVIEEEKSCCGKSEVLLVDDVLFNLIPLRAIMEDNINVKCDEAINGKIAVEMYQQNMTKTCCEIRYKLILTDIQMPEMDGISEAIAIKQLERTLRQTNPDLPQVRIVMITAFDTQEAIERCRDIGINDYLTKPVLLRQLLPICSEVFPDGRVERFMEQHEINMDQLGSFESQADLGN